MISLGKIFMDNPYNHRRFSQKKHWQLTNAFSLYMNYFASIYPFATKSSAESTAPPAAPLNVL